MFQSLFICCSSWILVVLSYQPHGPDTSLKTLPVTYHSLSGPLPNSGGHGSAPYPRPEADIQAMAKFRLIVIEKWEGPCWLACLANSSACNPTCNEEQYMLGTISRVKAINPNVSAVFYFNSLMNFPFYSFYNFFWRNGSLCTQNNKGEIGTITNDQGMGNLTVADFAQPSVRQLYVDLVANVSNSAHVDGIFADKSKKTAKDNQICNHGCFDITSKEAAAWTPGHLEMMAQVQNFLGDGLVMVEPGVVLPGINKTTAYPNFSAKEDDIQSMINYHKSGSYMYLIAYAKKCPEEVLAAFLMAVEEGMFLMCTQYSTDFERALGNPLAPATKQGHVWSRNFTSGTSATFNTKKNEGTVNWSS